MPGATEGTSGYGAYPPPVTAPDGSIIHELAASERASTVHCTLPVGAVTLAMRHRTVEEVWFVVSGTGELWRDTAPGDGVVALEPGGCHIIPAGAAFQFRTTGGEALRILITTNPPWPGMSEAEPAEGRWAPTLAG